MSIQTLTKEEKAELFNKLVRNQETTLQLHSLRYEASERSYDLFAKSAITLNGGALLALITTERIGGKVGTEDPFLIFAGWFVLGSVAFVLAAFLRYNEKRNFMNSPLTYFPQITEEEIKRNRVKHTNRLMADTSIILMFLSILFFSTGCGHGFLLMSGVWSP